jgi:glycosyltransferase involved in cell wall biosynthesis
VNVLLLSFEYPPETGFGGIGTYTWYQARALARLGHQVHVLAGATSETPLGRAEHDGVTVFRYRAAQGPMGAIFDRYRLWWTKNRLENAVSMYQGLQELTRQHGYDVIEMPECGGEGLFVNALCPYPTVVRFHSPASLIMDCYDVRRTDHVLCGALEQAGINTASHLTSCSAFLAREVRHRLGVERRISVLPNGIDLELFDASDQVDVRKLYGLPHDKLILLFAGRMEKRKGIHLFKEIVRRVLRRHDIAMVFAGQDLFGYLENDLLPYVKSQKLRGSFHYVGKLDLTHVRSCVRQSDIFMLPSLWENCPYSCLEAMAAGRAIVSSDAGGMPEMIEDGENGLLAATDDAASFAACLERLIEDPALRFAVGSAARRTVEQRYTDHRVAEQSTTEYAVAIRAANGARSRRMRATRSGRPVLRGRNPRSPVRRRA